MGTIRRLTPAAGDITLGLAADAYLATLRGAEHASTRRTYGRILRWIVTEFGGDTPPDIDPERFAAWFAAQWADRSPSTWNVSLDAIRSAAAWWTQQGWITADPSQMLKRRKPPARAARPAAEPVRAETAEVEHRAPVPLVLQLDPQPGRPRPDLHRQVMPGEANRSSRVHRPACRDQSAMPSIRPDPAVLANSARPDPPAARQGRISTFVDLSRRDFYGAWHESHDRQGVPRTCP